MSSYLAESLNSLAQSSALIDALTFRRTHAFSRAVLASEEQFETHMIRDAEPYELALFRPTIESRYDSAALLGDEENADAFGPDEKWTAAKRGGPQRVGGWDKASPLKERKGTAAAEDPDRCLRAALKLLDVYPLPRATEHVHALQDQFKGLVDAMVEHEEKLRRPIDRATTQPHEEEHLRASDLEDAIKREQMEIFALEQIHAERQAEVVTAASKARSRRISPTKPAPPGPNELNPFAKSDALEKRAAAVAAAQDSTPRGSPIRKTPTTTPRANRTTTSATPSPRSPAKSASPIKSPAARGPTGATPTKRTTALTSAASSRETTPKAVRTATRGGAVKASPQRDDKLTTGVSSGDLAHFSTKLWATLGEPLRPWARKTLIARDAEVPLPIDSLPFPETLATLRAVVLAGSSVSVDPVSPARSQTTATTATEDDPLPPGPSVVMEYQVLDLILSTFSHTPLVPPPAASLPPLAVTFRDPVLASSLATGATGFVAPVPGKKDPMVSMFALKAHMTEFAKTRGWSEEAATQSIYGLVSKQVLRIDRRGKDGPMLGFRM